MLFYHSSTEPPAVVGTAIVAREAYPDATARDPHDAHHDPKASEENPIWAMVDLKLDEIFPAPLPLERLRSVAALAKMELLRKGSRLSVQPVTAKEFEAILKLAHSAPPSAPELPAAKPPRRRSARRS